MIIRTDILSGSLAFLAVLYIHAAPAGTSELTGKSQNEVIKILGKPVGKAQNGRETMWLYDNCEVYFVSQKVSTVHTIARTKPSTPAPMPIAVPEPSKAVQAPQAVTAPSDIPVPDDAKALKAYWGDANSPMVSAINCSFGPKQLTAKEKEAQKAKGTIPIRITAMVVLSSPTPDPGKRNSSLSKLGNCQVRVYDEKGTLIINETVPTDKMCPSWGGKGGYFGEVAKEGTYMAVVTHTYPGHGQIGQVLKAELKL